MVQTNKLSKCVLHNNFKYHFLLLLEIPTHKRYWSNRNFIGPTDNPVGPRQLLSEKEGALLLSLGQLVLCCWSYWLYWSYSAGSTRPICTAPVTLWSQLVLFYWLTKPIGPWTRVLSAELESSKRSLSNWLSGYDSDLSFQKMTSNLEVHHFLLNGQRSSGSARSTSSEL